MLRSTLTDIWNILQHCPLLWGEAGLPCVRTVGSSCLMAAHSWASSCSFLWFSCLENFWTAKWFLAGFWCLSESLWLLMIAFFVLILDAVEAVLISGLAKCFPHLQPLVAPLENPFKEWLNAAWPCKNEEKSAGYSPASFTCSLWDNPWWNRYFPTVHGVSC